MTSGNGNLKERIYQSLCRSKAAVFSGDIADPSDLALALCGSRLPVTGGELLGILVELAQEGKMVVWRDGDTYGFLSAGAWEQEMDAIEVPALKADCEAMKLEGKDIADLKDSDMGIIAGILVSPGSGGYKDTRNLRCDVCWCPSPDKPGKDALHDGHEYLDESPDDRSGEGDRHDDAEDEEIAGEEGVVPADKLWQSMGEEANGYLGYARDAAHLDDRVPGQRVHEIELLGSEPGALDDEGDYGPQNPNETKPSNPSYTHH